MMVRIIENRRAETEVIDGKEKIVKIETTEIIAGIEVTVEIEMIPEIEIEEMILEIEVEDHLVENIGEDHLITLVEDHHNLKEMFLEVLVEMEKGIFLGTVLIIEVTMMRKR